MNQTTPDSRLVGYTLGEKKEKHLLVFKSGPGLTGCRVRIGIGAPDEGALDDVHCIVNRHLFFAALHAEGPQLIGGSSVTGRQMLLRTHDVPLSQDAVRKLPYRHVAIWIGDEAGRGEHIVIPDERSIDVAFRPPKPPCPSYGCRDPFCVTCRDKDKDEY